MNKKGGLAGNVILVIVSFIVILPLYPLIQGVTDDVSTNLSATDPVLGNAVAFIVWVFVFGLLKFAVDGVSGGTQ